jgi:hypothetical protein
MIMQFNREILSLYVKPQETTLNNIVNRVTWRFRVKDNSDFADLYLETYFDSVNEKSFVKYEDLTDEIVFGWIDAVENIELLKEELIEKLNESKAPEMVEKTIPWSYTGKYTGDEEYLIVFEDQPNDPLKIWGPMKWNSGLANEGLRERSIHNYEFPTDIVMYQRELLPIDQFILVTEGVKLYRVEYTEQPILNDIFQYHEGLTWVVTTGKAIGTYLIIDHTLEEAKKLLNQKLSNISFQKQISGTEIEFEGNIIEINTNFLARTSLVERWLLMNENDIINYKINDTLWLSLTKFQTKTILDLVQQHISNILNWEESVFEEIYSATDINTLKELEI